MGTLSGPADIPLSLSLAACDWVVAAGMGPACMVVGPKQTKWEASTRQVGADARESSSGSKSSSRVRLFLNSSGHSGGLLHSMLLAWIPGS